MRVAPEAEVDDARDGHQNGRSDHREAPRPAAGATVPALAEDVIHRRTPKNTPTCRTTIRRPARRSPRPLTTNMEASRHPQRIGDGGLAGGAGGGQVAAGVVKADPAQVLRGVTHRWRWNASWTARTFTEAASAIVVSVWVLSSMNATARRR